MCQISNKIKFCTCKAKDIDKLKNYWALYRYNEDKNVIIVGLPIFPVEDNFFEINRKTILARLSEADAFDILLNFEHKDKFVVEINTFDQHKRKQYAYEFLNDQWMESTANFFELEEDFDQITFGKLKSFKRNMK
ncbi:MAG: hypothetical protein RLZZ546_2649 [Bacteroidota bacterium]|jgi:hypothetical protein